MTLHSLGNRREHLDPAHHLAPSLTHSYNRYSGKIHDEKKSTINKQVQGPFQTHGKSQWTIESNYEGKETPLWPETTNHCIKGTPLETHKPHNNVMKVMQRITRRTPLGPHHRSNEMNAESPGPVPLVATVVSAHHESTILHCVEG